MTARLTTPGTLQCSSSFSGSNLFSAKAACTTSSTLDDIQLDITLRIHERISEFLSLSGITLPHSGTAATHGRIRWKEEEEVAAQRQAKKWDENSPPPPYLRKKGSAAEERQKVETKNSLPSPYSIQMQ